MSHNFDFLIKQYPDFEFFLTKAEDCHGDDPHNCIIKTCIVTECLLRNICISTETKISGQSTFSVMCDKLKKKKIIQNDNFDLLDNLDTLQKTRNIAAHSIINSPDIALQILNAFYSFSSWYYQKFIDSNFIPVGTFLYIDTASKKLAKIDAIEILPASNQNNVAEESNKYFKILELAPQAIMLPLGIGLLNSFTGSMAMRLGALIAGGYFTYKTFKTRKRVLSIAN